MSSSSRRTYDTDSITLRTVFAKNPGNSNVPALRVLTADGAGGTYWAIPSSLGLNPSFNEIITSAATYTADLSYNKFRLLAGENIGMVNGSAGSNQTTLFAKAFSQLDVSGDNSIAAFSNNMLHSQFTLAGENGVVIRADPATQTLFIGGSSASNTTISTGIYGFNQLKVTETTSSVTSSTLSLSGDFITSSSPSSLLRFLGINDILLSTNVTTNAVFFTISTFTSQGYLNISNAAYSAAPSTLSTISSLYVTSTLFGSTIVSISTSSGANVSSIYSTINGLAMSTGLEILTLQGLVNARATIVQLNNDIGTVNSNLVSTVAGLGSIGYLSTAGGGSGDVTSANLLSTVGGLGTANYVSTLSLYSTLSTFSTALGAIGTGSGDVTTGNLVSTVEGLGTYGYISSLSSITVSTIFNSGSLSTYSLEVFGSNTLTNSGSTILRGAIYLQGPLFVASSVTGIEGTIVNAGNLVSTVEGLGNEGYISSLSLVSTTVAFETAGFLSSLNLLSTVEGLGSIGYLSTLSTNFFSTGNIKAGNIEISTVTFKDVGNNELRVLNSSNNALYFNGSAVGSGNVINNFNTSTYVYEVSSVSTIFAYDSVVVSSATNVYLSPQFFSTVFFSTGANQTSSIEFIDTQTSAKQLLAVKNGALQLNGSAIQGDVTSVNLLSTIANLGTSGYVSTPSLVSTTARIQTSGYVSTANLLNLVSTNNLLNLVSTNNLQNLVSTNNLLNLVSTANLTNLISTTNLTSTVIGLSNIVVTKLIAGSNITLTPSGGQGDVTIDATGGGGGITTENLTSTVSGLSNIVVTQLIAGTNITLSPVGGQGAVTVTASGGGGGITTENLTSTVQGLGSSDYISSLTLDSITNSYFTSFSTNAIVLSSSASNYQLTASTNTITQQPYLWMNDRIYGTYNPITVVVSTLGNTNPSIFEYDVGKYFLLTQNNSGTSINLPTVNSSLNGWNVVVKNMPGSSNSFTVNTTASAVIGPGVATTVVCDGGSFYAI